MKHINRYNDEYTFTKTNEGVLWEGDFKHCRFSWPNDYTEAYSLYSKEEEDPVTLDDFKIKGTLLKNYLEENKIEYSFFDVANEVIVIENLKDNK